jgi:hypothetical protein
MMILIVTLFQEAINMKLNTPLDLVYLGASIALITLAQYFSHAADFGADKEKRDTEVNPRHDQ